MRKSTFADVKFARVIADKAHVLRNTKGQYHKLLSLVPTFVRGFVTATPTINRITDIIGYTRMIWSHASLPVTAPEGISFQEMAAQGWTNPEGEHCWFGEDTPNSMRKARTSGFSPRCPATLMSTANPSRPARRSC